jgi:hypothetical protein
VLGLHSPGRGRWAEVTGLYAQQPTRTSGNHVGHRHQLGWGLFTCLGSKGKPNPDVPGLCPQGHSRLICLPGVACGICEVASLLSLSRDYGEGPTRGKRKTRTTTAAAARHQAAEPKGGGGPRPRTAATVSCCSGGSAVLSSCFLFPTVRGGGARGGVASSCLAHVPLAGPCLGLSFLSCTAGCPSCSSTCSWPDSAQGRPGAVACVQSPGHCPHAAVLSGARMEGQGCAHRPWPPPTGAQAWGLTWPQDWAVPPFTTLLKATKYSMPGEGPWAKLWSCSVPIYTVVALDSSHRKLS